MDEHHFDRLTRSLATATAARRDVADIACTTNGGKPGACGTTTGNAGYCLVAGDCYACRTDLDCQRAEGGNLGPTAACIQCFGCTDHGGTACVSAESLGPMSLPEAS